MPPKIIANKRHQRLMNLMKSQKYKQLFMRAIIRYKRMKAMRLSGKKDIQQQQQQQQQQPQQQKIHVYNDSIEDHHNSDEKLYNHIIKYNYSDKLNYDLSKFNVTRHESTYEDSVLKLSDLILTTKMNDPYFRQFAIINNLDNYANNSLILIIDMPNWGGGTTMFMNTIVSMYKKTVNLLIARNFNNKVHFYINDEIKLANEYDETNSINFLHDNKDKINKIFVNHSIQHSKKFLLTVFLLNKHISTVTHDYGPIFKEPQWYMPEMLENNLPRTYIDLNMYDEIITQNEKNMCIYSKYLKNNSQIVVSTLPDYKQILNRIDTNNLHFVIGVIGNISNRKGSYIINKLIDYSKINENIKVIIFGKVQESSYIHQYQYSNIEQLNTLLITHKPNILLETSLWPETYSYTLTLMMLTQLPIFYQKKQFDNVVENRLSTYSKAYGFININAFIKNINTVIKLKQNYLYLIDSNIYFNKCWANYFTLKTTECNNILPTRNLVFICSKIYVSNKPFTYTTNRSIHTPAQRLEQTLNTIKSIKKYIPNYYIILFDNSEFNNNEYKILHDSVDLFINITTDDILNDFTNNKISKIYGITAQKATSTSYIRNLTKTININNLFIISGRYTINNTFDYSQYDNDYNIFKQNNEVTDRKYYYTSFYKISKSNLEQYFTVFEEFYKECQNSNYYDNGIDFEVVVPQKLHFNFKTVERLGITQNIAVWDQKDNI